jgi:hypothetical protein
MKSADSFWNVIALYHQQTFWNEIIMTSIGVALTFLIYLKPADLFQRLMKIYLSISFAWVSIVFSRSMDNSPLSLYFVGPLFLLIAILFLTDLQSHKIIFTWPGGLWQNLVTLILFALVMGYPLLSFLLGHRYPAITTPYLPCPLTAFPLILLSASLPHVDRKMYILLLVWAMMALPKGFGLFNVRKDSNLFLIGIYSLMMLIIQWKDIKPITFGKSAAIHLPVY